MPASTGPKKDHITAQLSKIPRPNPCMDRVRSALIRGVSLYSWTALLSVSPEFYMSHAQHSWQFPVPPPLPSYTPPSQSLTTGQWERKRVPNPSFLWRNNNTTKVWLDSVFHTSSEASSLISQDRTQATDIPIVFPLYCARKDKENEHSAFHFSQKCPHNKETRQMLLLHTLVIASVKGKMYRSSLFLFFLPKMCLNWSLQTHDASKQDSKILSNHLLTTKALDINLEPKYFFFQNGFPGNFTSKDGETKQQPVSFWSQDLCNIFHHSFTYG